MNWRKSRINSPTFQRRKISMLRPMFICKEVRAPAELIARNEDLLQEVSSLSKKLEASESRLEQLETLRAPE